MQERFSSCHLHQASGAHRRIVIGRTYSALDQSGGPQCVVDDRTDVRKGRRRFLPPYWLVILVEDFALQHRLRPLDLMGRRRKLHHVSFNGSASNRDPEKLCNVIG